MRNEKTHFYGYLQTPAGHALGIVSPQPVASWSVAYNLGYQDPPPHWFMGHPDRVIKSGFDECITFARTQSTRFVDAETRGDQELDDCALWI